MVQDDVDAHPPVMAIRLSSPSTPITSAAPIIFAPSDAQTPIGPCASGDEHPCEERGQRLRDRPARHIGSCRSSPVSERLLA
jgi:hypothetical protein